MPRGSSTRALAAIFVLACAAWYVWRAVVLPFPGANASDFSWYYLAAQHVIHGESPYLAAGYIYPPMTAFLLTPLAVFPYVPARRAWFLLSHGFLLTAAWTLWRRAGSDWKSACSIAFVWAAGGAAEESLALGQIGPLLTLLITLSSFPGRLRGAATSLGCALKLFPSILGLTLLLERRWFTLLRTAIYALLLLLLPWAFLQLALKGPRVPAHMEFLAGTPTMLSWSAPSIALRAVHPPGRDGKPPSSWIDNNLASVALARRDRAISLGVGALTLSFGLGVLLFATRARLGSDAVPSASAALIALTLAAAPVCWTHYEVLQYPGAALLLARAAQRSDWMRFLTVLTAWSFLYTVPVTVLRAAYAVHHGWPPQPAYLYFWTSISAVASLALFLLAVRETVAAQPKFAGNLACERNVSLL